MSGFASDFRSDPLGWAGNQCGHWVAGLVFWRMGIEPVLAVLLYLAVVESWQTMNGKRGWRLVRDSLEDALFVAAGAWFVLLGMLPALGLGMAIRWWRRC